MSFKCHQPLTNSASAASLNEAPRHRHPRSTSYKLCLVEVSVEERYLPGPGCGSLGFRFSASRQRGCWTRGHRSGHMGSSQFQHPVPSEYQPVRGKRGDVTQPIPHSNGNPNLWAHGSVICQRSFAWGRLLAFRDTQLYYLCHPSGTQGPLPEAGTWIQAWPCALSYSEDRLVT